MRLFVALEIPSTVRDNLAALIKDLRAVDASGSKSNMRWVRPENLHVTLKFIGQVDAAKLEAIRGALSEARLKGAADLRFRGLGFFPNEKRATVFWAGIEASPNLSQIATAIDERLAKLGIPRETKAFKPHLTLARLEPPGLSAAMHAAIQQRSVHEFGESRTTEFHLIESKTRPSGAEYTRLFTFRFGEAEA